MLTLPGQKAPKTVSAKDKDGAPDVSVKKRKFDQTQRASDSSQNKDLHTPRLHSGSSQLSPNMPSRSSPPTSRYPPQHSRAESRNNKAANKGIMRVVQGAEQRLFTNIGSNSREEKLALPISSSPSHHLTGPTSLSQSKVQALSASEPPSLPLAIPHPQALPPEDGLEGQSAESERSVTAKDNISSSAPRVREQASSIKPKMASQKGRRINSTSVSSSTVSSLSPRPSIYPSLNSNSRPNASAPPILPTKLPRKSFPQDRQTTPRVARSSLGCGTGSSDRDDVHDSARSSSERKVRAPVNPIRDNFASLSRPNIDISSSSSESTTTSSSSTSLGTPLFSSRRPSSQTLTSTTITNQRPLSSDLLNSNFLSSTHETLQQQLFSKDKSIKSSPSSVDMAAVNIAYNSCSPIPPSQTFSVMMPQLSGSFCYPPQMTPQNPFLFTAMVDSSGRPLSVDLPMMQQHMLNPYSVVPSHGFTKTPVLYPYPSGKPHPPANSRRSTDGHKGMKSSRITGASNSSDKNSVPRTSRVVPRETGKLQLGDQRHTHVSEAKSSHVISQPNPHKQRSDKKTFGNDSIPPSAYTRCHPKPHAQSSNGDSRRISSSSATLYHRSSRTSRYSTGDASLKKNSLPSASGTPGQVLKSEPISIPTTALGVEDDSSSASSITSKSETDAWAEEENALKKHDKQEQSQQSGAGVTQSITPPSPTTIESRESHVDSISPVEEIQVSEQLPATYFPLTLYLSHSDLLGLLLQHLSFRDFCMIMRVSKTVRMMLTENELLREEVLERFLKSSGYLRWAWREPEFISLTLRDLHDYMRGMMTPISEYTRVAELYLKQLKVRHAKRDPDVLESAVLLRDATRAYNRVIGRLRAQAERDPDSFTTSSGSKMSSESPLSESQQSSSDNTHDADIPLFRPRRAPLFRVFIPSPEGDWLSDASVHQCEAELKYAGLLELMRMGDVVWDIAVGDNGNFGRMIWDGKYLVDLDYTYSEVGDLPKYIPALAFPPSYFHRVLRTSPTSSDPLIRLDISSWGQEIASNLQLLQNRRRTVRTPSATYNTTNWVHQSSFMLKSPLSQSRTSKWSEQLPKSLQSIPIPGFTGMYVDSSWYGKIVIETEGTGDSLTDLQDRCGPGAFPSRAKSSTRSLMTERSLAKEMDARTAFRIIRERSRPGEIWLRTVSAKERRV